MDMMTAAHHSADIAIGVMAIIFLSGLALYLWSGRR